MLSTSRLVSSSCPRCASFKVLTDRGGLTIWKLGHCLRARVSRGPHEMPLLPFSWAFLSLSKDTGAP
ncbi:unnamed protein product [Staurois parvus]|uniref:Uncharacterized protein n=1 Tax=Staurois parvus TaxID=386267 RepID=A0ABN9GG24_9NEOB|nr:unnamed protein product [Staurois parvus]